MKYITRLFLFIILAVASQSCSDEDPEAMFDFTANITPISITSTTATFKFEVKMSEDVSMYTIYASSEDDYRGGRYSTNTNILTFTNLHPNTKYKIMPDVHYNTGTWGGMSVEIMSDEWTFTTLPE